MLWYRHPRAQRLFDAGLTFVVAGPLLLASVFGAVGEHERAPLMSALAMVLALVQGLALLARRRYPVGVFAVALVAAVALELVAGLHTPPVGVIAAAGSLAAFRPWRTSLPAAALSLLIMVPDLSFGTVADLFRAGFLAGLVAVAWTVGDAARARRNELAQLQERAETAEREREERTLRAVAEEQARIARELHDVIAHNVSVMVVQAAAARDVFDERPDRAREALGAIEDSGREAMAELRRLLGVVRAAESPPGAGGLVGDPSSPAAGAGGIDLAPQPGLDRVDALVRQVRSAGLPVALTVEGHARALPAGIDLSAYRIVQEALTNALRHAHAGQAQVTVRYGEEAVELDVRDDGVGGTPNGGGGHGIVGMRERAALLGGTLEAGPGEGGGFRVRARLPLQEAAG